jgi:hypothetical protein
VRLVFFSPADADIFLKRHAFTESRTGTLHFGF